MNHEHFWNVLFTDASVKGYADTAHNISRALILAWAGNCPSNPLDYGTANVSAALPREPQGWGGATRQYAVGSRSRRIDICWPSLRKVPPMRSRVWRSRSARRSVLSRRRSQSAAVPAA